MAVRVLAVLTALYAFFSLRSNIPSKEPPSRAIPVMVMKAQICGWVTANPSQEKGTNPPQDLLPILSEAIETPGTPVAVRSKAECDKLAGVNTTTITTDRGSFQIDFRKN